jgi:uncharacterized protein (TIGR02594 family)
MATLPTTDNARQRTGAWIKSDEIRLDTSSAPWMAIARAELGKKVHELAAKDAFIASLRQMLTLGENQRAAERLLQNFGQDSMLLGRQPGAFDPGRLSLGVKPLPDMARQFVGRMEAKALLKRNPEIEKYFQGVKTDPAFDKKAGRSFELAVTYEAEGEGRITAWCAAFVNWCLAQSGAPRRGYATAISWLDFGTPVAHPVSGCVTVVKPSKSTGSTTGHVGFFVRSEGTRVVLLGGNQRDAVSEQGFNAGNVLGHRWPTRFNHYLAAGTGNDALA